MKTFKKYSYLKYRLVCKIHRFLVHKTRVPICQGFDGPCFKRGKKLRQNTAYADDSRNWVVMCEKCAEANSKYWYGMWQDYYSMVR